MRSGKGKMLLSLCGFIVCFIAIPCNAQQKILYDKITSKEFKNPPVWAKPKTWLHSMSGNMSKVGFTKDLEAISDVGMNGVLLFNVSRLLPYGNITFASAEHLDILKHAASECERLGLAFGVHNCDGWTASGGPWNTPENSMKMVVSRSVVVDGGKEMKLPLPAIQGREGYYEDIAVIAYPALQSQIEDYGNLPVVTSNDGNFDSSVATDELINKRTLLTGSRKSPAYIQFAYKEPFTLRRIDMLLEKGIPADGTAILSRSDDGVNFTEITELKIKRMGKREYGFDDQFPEVTARYFRITVFDKFEISEVSLRSTSGIDNYLERISLYKKMDHAMRPLIALDKNMVIAGNAIRNLTDYVDKDGFLRAYFPKGKWTIMRFGYTSTGYVNSPASDEGRGLEVDKMSREAMKVHYDSYIGKVINAVREVAPTALQYMEMDSYEVGGQNWTHNYEALFLKKYGYDLIPFLPLYSGLIVDNSEVTENVLSDIRRLNNQLITENYFKYFTELCNTDGLKSYIEPYSINGPFCELDAARYADVPMGEFWLHQRYVTGTAVSSAHIYGKRKVSSEAFSARSDVNWKGHPGLLKNTGDQAWCLGINEYMFHRYVHQPNTHVVPGMTMDEFGSHIDRNQTWWESAGKAWMEYIARGQYMLQQGIPVSDLLVFVGDGAPSDALNRKAFSPEIPNYLNYDCVNADVLCNRFRICDGNLILPEGTTYKILALHNSKKISLEVLRKLDKYSENGLIIVGQKPVGVIGHRVTEEQKSEFKTLADRIWQRGTTYSTFVWDEILSENKYIPDLLIENGKNLNYAHRHLSDEDIYFFYNPDSVEQVFNCNFRITEKVPELWNPMTGNVQDIVCFFVETDVVRVPLKLAAGESVFVVFKRPVELSDNKKCVQKVDKGAILIEGDWNMVFGKGTDREMTLSTPLFDWKDSHDEYVKYFSGTAFYSKEFEIPASFNKPDIRFRLSLGAVNIACRVKLNGKEMGVWWYPPFEADVTDIIRSGVNHLEVEVTNLWTNRLIGDKKLPDTSGYDMKADKMPEWFLENRPMPEGERMTFTTYDFYKSTGQLMPSGIVGPVVVRMQEEE